MAISSEFAQAVRDENKLRIRIMLKDSLLIDKSFRLFDEMQAYAMAQGVSPWADADVPLEKAEKPWTEDIMNYELTALVNDFTREHVNYIKQIIADLYKVSASDQQAQRVYNAQHSPQQMVQPAKRIDSKPSQVGGKSDPYETIVLDWRRIKRILSRTTNEGKWYSDDINSIKHYAQDIVDICNEIQRRG